MPREPAREPAGPGEIRGRAGLLGPFASWFLVLGFWFLVLGSWCLVLGAWCLVLGFWFLVVIFLFFVFGSSFLDYGSPGLRCIRTHAYVCTRPCPFAKLWRRRRPVGFSTDFQQNAHSPSPQPIPALRDSWSDRRRFRRADRRLL